MKNAENRTKSKICLAALLSLAMLSTGCQNSEASSAATSDNSSSETTSHTHITEDSAVSPDSTPSNTDTENLTFTGELGETLCLADAAPTNPISYGDNLYRFEGWTYMSLSDGVVWNSVANSDIDYEGSFDFPAQEATLFKAENGSAAGGLTLENAYADFQVNSDNIFLKRVHAEYSGQITLKGYLYTFPEASDYMEKGDIFFLADNGEWNGLPYFNLDYNNNHWWTEKDFHWVANAPILRLGNIEDYDFDLDFIKTDGEVVHASVVLDGLDITDGQVTKIYKSTLVEAEAI